MTEKNTAQSDYVKALNEMENAKMNSVNPFFESKYADYASVKAATDPALKAHNLALAHKTTYDGELFLLISEVIHTSGEVVNASVYPLNSSSKAQDIGSEMTYARRYNRSMLCGISSEEDEDGNHANKQEKPEMPKKKAESKWCGPLSVKELGDKMADFNADIKAVEDSASYEKLVRDAQDLLDQATADWPDGYTKTQANMTKARARIEEIEGDPFG